MMRRNSCLNQQERDRIKAWTRKFVHLRESIEIADRRLHAGILQSARLLWQLGCLLNSHGKTYWSLSGGRLETREKLQQTKQKLFCGNMNRSFPISGSPLKFNRSPPTGNAKRKRFTAMPMKSIRQHQAIPAFAGKEPDRPAETPVPSAAGLNGNPPSLSG